MAIALSVATTFPDAGFVTPATPVVVPSAAFFVLLASDAGTEGGKVFNDWLPFAIYGLFALMIPATMMIGS
ncbi:MAG TPA: hypothetical protein VGF66_03140, partial [Gaiellaceae bacterium]